MAWNWRNWKWLARFRSTTDAMPPVQEAAAASEPIVLSSPPRLVVDGTLVVPLTALPPSVQAALSAHDDAVAALKAQLEALRDPGDPRQQRIDALRASVAAAKAEYMRFLRELRDVRSEVVSAVALVESGIRRESEEAVATLTNHQEQFDTAWNSLDQGSRLRIQRAVQSNDPQEVAILAREARYIAEQNGESYAAVVEETLQSLGLPSLEAPLAPLPVGQDRMSHVQAIDRVGVQSEALAYFFLGHMAAAIHRGDSESAMRFSEAAWGVAPSGLRELWQTSEYQNTARAHQIATALGLSLDTSLPEVSDDVTAQYLATVYTARELGIDSDLSETVFSRLPDDRILDNIASLGIPRKVGRIVSNRVMSVFDRSEEQLARLWSVWESFHDQAQTIKGHQQGGVYEHLSIANRSIAAELFFIANNSEDGVLATFFGPSNVIRPNGEVLATRDAAVYEQLQYQATANLFNELLNAGIIHSPLEVVTVEQVRSLPQDVLRRIDRDRSGIERAYRTALGDRTAELPGESPLVTSIALDGPQPVATAVA